MPRSAEIMHEYFYGKLCEIDEKMETVIIDIRHKRGVLILCEEIRRLEIEKRCYEAIYDDLRLIFR